MSAREELEELCEALEITYSELIADLQDYTLDDMRH